jgi:hypothetical protein
MEWYVQILESLPRRTLYYRELLLCGCTRTWVSTGSLSWILSNKFLYTHANTIYLAEAEMFSCALCCMFVGACRPACVLQFRWLATSWDTAIWIDRQCHGNCNVLDGNCTLLYTVYSVSRNNFFLLIFHCTYVAHRYYDSTTSSMTTLKSRTQPTLSCLKRREKNLRLVYFIVFIHRNCILYHLLPKLHSIQMFTILSFTYINQARNQIWL